MSEPPSKSRVPLVPKIIMAFIVGLLITIAIFAWVEFTRKHPEPEYFPIPPKSATTNNTASAPGK